MRIRDRHSEGDQPAPVTRAENIGRGGSRERRGATLPRGAAKSPDWYAIGYQDRETGYDRKPPKTEEDRRLYRMGWDDAGEEAHHA